MLKPINHLTCSPALRACQQLQVHLTTWLCNATVGEVDIIQANLVPPRVPTQIEANWLWTFLQKTDSKATLLSRAKILAAMSAADKELLISWVIVVDDLTRLFQPVPPVWPERPTIPKIAWKAFKELMEAFYEKGLRSGLPYAANGTPIVNAGVNYTAFVQEFRNVHRLNSAPNAREVCVLCGGSLGQTPEVDHWIAKSLYPLLSVCADNLLPICGECNSTSNKGNNPVYTNGSFDDWFHPYLRQANGGIQMDYNLQTRTIVASATGPADDTKVTNIDKLLNLAARWTREFKAEYVKQQSVLIRRERLRVKNGKPRHTQQEILVHLQSVQNDLMSTEPHYEVHIVLCKAMLNQTRLAVWQSELGLV